MYRQDNLMFDIGSEHTVGRTRQMIYPQRLKINSCPRKLFFLCSRVDGLPIIFAMDTIYVIEKKQLEITVLHFGLDAHVHPVAPLYIVATIQAT